MRLQLYQLISLLEWVFLCPNPQEAIISHPKSEVIAECEPYSGVLPIALSKSLNNVNS
jgi:hypothetical protein